MNEEEQVLFAQWLAKKIGAKTEEEFKTAIEQLGEDGVKEAYSMFQEENNASQADLFKEGGKFSYIDCLKKYKTGNKIDCGCGKKKVAKGFSGLIAAAGKAVTKAPQLAKVATKVPTMGQKIAGAATNLKRSMGSVQGISNTLGKVGSAVGKAGQIAQGIKGTGVKAPGQVVTPSVTNNYYGANAGAIESPTMKPMPRQVPVFTGNDIPNGGITNNTPVRRMYAEGGILYAQRGEKLRGRALKNYKEGENENGTIRKLHRADRIEARQDARAERRIARRGEELVKEYNYQGEEIAPGVFQRARSRFDEGAEALLRARQPLQVSGTSIALPATRPTLPIIPDSSRGIEPLSTVKQLPPDYNEEEVFNAAIDQAFPRKKEMVSPASTTKAVTALPQAQPQAKPKVNPANIKGGKSAPATSPVGSGVVAKQIRVPNLQYPGSTTIMPGNAIGEVEVSAPSIPKRAVIQPKPNSVVPTNPRHAEAVKTWLNNYAKAKAMGDKMGMRHWQDLLETAGGEGRPK